MTVNLELSAFENAVLGKLLSGDHATLVQLRAQLSLARVVARESTGVGFFLNLEVPSAASLGAQNFHVGDVVAEIDGLQYGAGFVVFVRDGRLSGLEGYSYDEPWPSGVCEFTLSYVKEPRVLELPAASR